MMEGTSRNYSISVEFVIICFSDKTRQNCNCPENVVLQNLYDSMSSNDEERMEEVAGAYLGLLWPFIQMNYESRKHSNKALNLTEVVKLQVVTRNGVLVPISYDAHIPTTEPVKNNFPGVPTYRLSDIQQLSELETHVFKVVLNNLVYCMKTVPPMGNEKGFIHSSALIRISSISQVWWRLRKEGLKGCSLNSLKM
jgi:hypothetical protein